MRILTREKYPSGTGPYRDMRYQYTVFACKWPCSKRRSNDFCWNLNVRIRILRKLRSSNVLNLKKTTFFYYIQVRSLESSIRQALEVRHSNAQRSFLLQFKKYFMVPPEQQTHVGIWTNFIRVWQLKLIIRKIACARNLKIQKIAFLGCSRIWIKD